MRLVPLRPRSLWIVVEECELLCPELGRLRVLPVAVCACRNTVRWWWQFQRGHTLALLSEGVGGSGYKLLPKSPKSPKNPRVPSREERFNRKPPQPSLGKSTRITCTRTRSMRSRYPILWRMCHHVPSHRALLLSRCVADLQSVAQYLLPTRCGVRALKFGAVTISPALHVGVGVLHLLRAL